MRISITVACFFILTSAIAQKFDRADKYIQFISRQQKSVAKKFLHYDKAISYIDKSHSAKKIESIYNSLIDKLTDARKNIDSLPTSKKDSVYKDSALSYFKQYATLLNTDYNKVTGMQAEAQQSYDGMQAFLDAKESADRKMKKLNERFYATTIKFATNNKVTIPYKSDTISEQMEKTIETGSYFKQVYLIFFKSYKQEADIQNAIQRKDVTDVQKGTKDLSKSAEDGQNRLDTIQAFRKDNSLLACGKEVLAFYEKEADDKIDPITDYFSAAKDFEDIRATFEKKPGHSGQEVKAYKKSVKKFNKALSKYNKAMSGLYKKKKSLLKKWNNTTHAFINKHMPKL